MRPFYLPGYVFLTAVLLPVAAQGQVSGGSGGPPPPPLPSGCTINTGSSPNLRSESMTEAVSDLVFACQQMPSLSPGQPAPQVNITVTLPVPVTSRLLNGNVSEALLLIDDPNSGLSAPIPGFGPTEPFTVCTTPLTGCPAWAQQVTIQNGLGSTTYAVAVNSPTASASPANAAPNVYQGIVSGNQVSFYGIPVLPPGTNSERVLRITNIRINASALPVGTAVQASVSVSDPAALPLLSAPVQTVGSTYSSLSASVDTPGDFSACNASTLQQATILSYAASSPPNPGPVDSSPATFRTRMDPAAVGSTSTPFASLAQDVPGTVYNAESDFTLAVPGSAPAGLADFGTRFKAVFNNVPTGVRLFVSTTNVVLQAGTGLFASPQFPATQLVTGETTPYAVPAASAQVPGSNISVVEITPAAGSHTATAVWEVVGYSTSLQFAVYVTNTAGSIVPGTTTVNLSYAPTTGTTIPRFIDTSTPLSAFSITSGCQSPSTVTLTASPNPSVWGQPVTLTATVPAGATGTVSFFQGLNTPLGTPVPLSGNTASVTFSSLPALQYSGTTSVLAVYNGDGNFLSSTSNQASLTINKAATTTVVTPSPDRSIVTATVTANPPGSGVPTGTVSFFDGPTQLGSAPLMQQGSLGAFATWNVTTANDSITALYAGDSNFLSSTSATVPLHGGPLSCAATTGDLPLVRSEGITEIIGDVVIDCAGGAALTPGQPVPRVNITLTLPASVTNRLLDGNASDALLLLDEPNASLETPVPTYVPGFGSEEPFTICTTPLTGCAAWAQSATGLLNQTYQVAVNSPTASATAGNGAPNVYQGIVSGNQVTFYGVPVLPPVVGARILRITNVRIDATHLPVPVTPSIAVSNTTVLPINGQTIVPVYAGPSLTTSAATPTAVACDSQTLQQATVLNFTESSTFYSSAFKPRLDPTAASQSVPGILYQSESGLLVPISSGITAGLADFGTRLKAVFHNVPSGVRLFVSLTNVTTDSNGTVTGSVPQPLSSDTSLAFAEMVTSETAAFSPASPTAQASVSNVSLVEITPAAGSTTATAVWEVRNERLGLFTTDSLQFAVFVSTPGAASSATGTVNLSYAPTGSVSTIPRFLDTSSPTPAINLSCPIYVPPVLTLTSSQNPSTFGQAVTFTFSMTPPGTAAPVQFYDGTTLLGSATLNNGQASFTTLALLPGSHAISATYNGLSTSFGQVVNGLAPTVTLTVSNTAPTVGQSLILTAQLGPTPPSGVPAPTGQIQFRDAGLSVGTATLASGAASFTASNLTPGVHSFMAIYPGDQYWAAGHSTTLNITVTPPALQLTNAATNLSTFAPDELVSMFNVIGLNGSTGATLPLSTSLAGVSIAVKDSSGAQRPALLYGAFAAAGQVNFVVPAGTAAGAATVLTAVPSGPNQSTQITIGNVAPGIFTANQNGQGTFAGQIVYVNTDGSQTVVESAALSGTAFAATPINLSSGTSAVFLQLYGTGLRHATSLTATVNGTSVPTVYAAQGAYPGLDQVNLQIPTTLAGAGTVNIVITADGQTANAVTALIQ